MLHLLFLFAPAPSLIAIPHPLPIPSRPPSFPPPPLHCHTQGNRNGVFTRKVLTPPLSLDPHSVPRLGANHSDLCVSVGLCLSCRYMTLETRKDGTKFTNRALKDAAERQADLSSRYETLQRDLVAQVRGTATVWPSHWLTESVIGILSFSFSRAAAHPTRCWGCWVRCSGLCAACVAVGCTMLGAHGAHQTGTEPA